MEERYILLVEDNADDAYLAVRVINKVCEDEVIVARDGEEAHSLLKRMLEDGSYRRIRLLLLDLKLPKVGGIELLEIIRATPQLKHLDVAVLTSSENERDQEMCRELGIRDYFFKPLSAEVLQRVLDGANKEP